MIIKHNSLVLENDKSLGFPVKHKEFIMGLFDWGSPAQEAAHEATAERIKEVEVEEEDDDKPSPPPRRPEPEDDEPEDKPDGGPGRGNW